MVDWEKTIKAYALKNALEHEGKCQESSIISSLFHEGLKREQVKEVIKQVKTIVSEVNKLDLEKQKKEFNKLEKNVSHRAERVGLPELPNVPKTGVIMRFRPAPSGPLHIGHMISNMVSSLYVKKYGGKFYIIADDTNPEETLPEAYKKIKEDCDWLFGNVYKYINSSDRMELYYDYAEKLLKLGKVYVCTCNQEKFKELVDKKKTCPCRDNDIKENLEKWKKMLDKKGYKEGQAVLRFKSSIDNPNPALRDFPLARINTKTHPLQKDKFRVWPLMNLVVSVDDIEYKMTHIIRGKDHRDNAERQKMIYQALGLEEKYPWTFFMGRIKFGDIILSKRKIKASIEAGDYESWDDPRLPTISSLRKRGYLPEAFAKLAEQRGLSEVDKVMNQKDFFQLLDEFNQEAKQEKSS
ncbi:MAG: glutamate--tRNA ligase family protein [Candidatus Pacearchaeota archaeon]|nr:glutamate--tRNA ligase family protein [Candidatus Pacearchaeota archaeon]